jgi:Bacterial inner membrane protein
MDYYILGQVVGFIGYVVFLFAPYAQSKQQMMRIELLACSILTLQWLLLGHLVLVISNMIGIFSLGVALSRLGDRYKDVVFLGLYPVSVMFVAYIWQGSILDVLTMFSLLMMITARRTSDVMAFRGYSALCGGTLAVCGFLTLSIPAMIFNTLFMAGHLQKLCTPIVIRGIPRFSRA